MEELNWHLYRTKDGWQEANHELNMALDKVPGAARHLFMENDISLRDALIKAAKEKVVPVMETYQSFGAQDSEPRQVLADALTGYLEHLTGVNEDNTYFDRWSF